MRRFLLFLLLLPFPLFSQVKILMPAVVKNAQGQPVTDLQLSDFQVSGPKNVSVEKNWLVPAEIASPEDDRAVVIMLFDLANAHGEVPGQELLERIAKDRTPVTILINTTDGLQVLCDPATPPEVLSAALAVIRNSKASNSPEIERQVEKLRLLNKLDRNHAFRYDPGFNQMNSLIAVAKLLGSSDKRKAVLWPTRYTGFNAHDVRCELITEALNAAHVSIYPVPTPQEILADSPFIALAQGTGGLSFTFVGEYKNTVKVTWIWDALQKAIEDLGPYYMLAVQVPTPKDTDWIPVKIKVNRPGVTVRSASGFFGIRPMKK